MGAYVWHAFWCTEMVAGSVGALCAPQTLSLQMEHPPRAGQLLPVPVTAMVQTTTTTTITSTVAIMQHRLDWCTCRTPVPPGAVHGAAGYWYPMSSMLIDPEAWAGHGSQCASSRDCRYVAGRNGYAGAGMHLESSICSGPSIRFEKIGAVDGAPDGTVGHPESNGCRGYGSLCDRARMAKCFKQSGARAKVAGVAEYQWYGGISEDVVHADQASQQKRLLD